MTTIQENVVKPNNKLPIAISFRLLLWVYAIIPLCLLVYAIDVLFYEGYLKSALPTSPKHFLLFQLLFGTPHIIASAILLTSNPPYLHHFKGRLIGVAALIALVYGLGSLVIPYLTLYVLTACITVFHVLKQQHGIAKGVCRMPDWAFYLLLGLSIAAGCLVYLGIFLKNTLEPAQLEIIRYSAATLTLGLLVATVICQSKVNSGFGKLFLWANSTLIFSSFYLYTQEYYFLAILVPRLVHDSTAFIFYVAHDYNKHHKRPENTLYRVTQKLNVHIFIVLPVLSFFAAFVLQTYGDAVVAQLSSWLFGSEVRKAVSLGLLGYLALMHYYTESFTWKNDSPYRRFIAFSK